MASATRPKEVGQLGELARLIETDKAFSDVVAALRERRPATIDGAWGSACALAVAALARQSPTALLVVTPHLSEVDDLADDIATFSGVRPMVLPAWETLPQEQLAADDIFARRIGVLKRIGKVESGRLAAKGEHGASQRLRSIPVLVTSIHALLQPVPSAQHLRQHERTLRVGEAIEIERVLGELVDAGLTRTSAVELPGEFAMHGGILDIFPFDAVTPVRVELFGDDVESLRHFDPETQRSLERLDTVAVTLLAQESTTPHASAHLCDFLPDHAWVVLVEPDELVEQGGHYLHRLDDARGLYSVESTLKKLLDFGAVSIAGLARAAEPPTCNLHVESVERFSGDVLRVKEELESAAGDQEVFLACHNEAEQHRMGEVLAESALAQRGLLHLCVGHVSRGFRLAECGVLVLSDNQLFQRSQVRRPGRRRHRGRPIESFLDLSEGDFVVHVTHGIARYRGLELLHKRDGVDEHLVLEFRERTKLYVPSAKIGLVQKYVGGSAVTPTLSKLGGTAWQRRKQRVERAVVDMAAEMIELQAARQAQPGIAFPPDTEWQREFDASFPYTETPDQLETDVDIKTDMQRPRPMDRLICGDVGYGKTELAMRAAFKAAGAGKQVAVLVPTTVLAEQHFRTFRQRMAEYPVTIDVLSRFRSKQQQRATLDQMESGGLDIVIGTHRLVQSDVRFRDLGLVIIDEEQRFGVEHKEQLKALRRTVDVLTLTATPIPRTLHMSLLGIRDISNLETPPHDRLAIETRISRFDKELIRQAVLRELNRAGQVFFVHNRVESIGQVAAALEQIVPEAILRIAHGQMPEAQLSEAMLDFVQRRCDMLVATTIIESGLDIPNANTIFINWADRYGLADLHQLRGRVGRYNHRAYCYLLLDPKRPVTAKGAKRLKAIEEFSALGAGFHIAMRDLEIRGAGNILGSQQSGHIASVGYEMYCQLLAASVRRLQGRPLQQPADVAIQLPWPAYLPRDYVASQRQKMDLYRRLSRVENVEELADFEAELTDRFGSPSPPVENLLANNELRLLAQAWQIDAIYLESRYLVLRYRDASRMGQLSQREHRLRIADDKSAYLPLPKQLCEVGSNGEPDTALKVRKLYLQIKSLLQLSS